MAENEEEYARKYGELTCDIPYVTAVKQMESLVKYAKENLPEGEKIDLILWTGDSVSHDLHRTT